ncbi:MAG: preprotein translocase, SecG subunit [Gemmatimonadetes bacterium]|nr:preprotein translocase, SecG subunit [Gemmatimonadota bacterium]
MFSFLLTLLIIDSVVLIAAILLQSGKGNGLAASFGGVSSSADSLLGTRQAGNLLTKTSWWGGGIFLFLSFVLSISSARQRAPKSVLDQAFQTPAPATAPATTAPAANVVPGLTPATPAPTAPAGPPASAPSAKP